MQKRSMAAIGNKRGVFSLHPLPLCGIHLCVCSGDV